MTFYDVMFVAVPALCGCYIRNVQSYPRCYVPLTISERLCRYCPVMFRDASDGSSNVEVWIENVPTFRINPQERKVFESMNWVELSTTIH